MPEEPVVQGDVVVTPAQPQPATPITVVVTKRSDAMNQSTTVMTNDAIPDVKFLAMTGVARVFIRALRAFVTTMSGTLGSAGVGLDGGALPDDFQKLLLVSAQLALGAAIASSLINSGELLLKIDEKIPQMRG